MFGLQAEFWVAVAFVILLVVLGYFGVHGTILKALDHRRERIQKELADARRLKDEAAALLADYRARRDSAVREADEIIANAKADAERIAAEAKGRMEEFVARRTKSAEAKIAMAEAQALADVRAAAAEAAVSAAATIMSHSVKGAAADDLVARGIDEVKARLN
jgi:F-type H+-transporting ATPase subunit b